MPRMTPTPRNGAGASSTRQTACSRRSGAASLESAAHPTSGGVDSTWPALASPDARPHRILGADFVNLEAYSHECISAGWWAGDIAGPVSDAAFYAYAYPEPPGCPEAPVRPEAAYYHEQMHLWILPHEAVRTAPDPDAALMEFLESTYSAAADLGGWDRARLERGRNSG